MPNSTVAEIEVSRGAVTGAIFGAPAGTALPTDATTALAAAYKNYGYIGADGISPSRDVSTDDVPDMNGDNLRTLQTGFAKSYSAPMLQVRNVDLNKAIFGTANVTETAATSTAGRKLAIVDRGTVAAMGVLVIETFDGLGKQRRVLPVAQVTSVEEGALVGTAVQQFTLTWSCYKDTTGAYEYKYDDDGVFTA